MDPNDQNGGGELDGAEVPDLSSMDHDAYYEHVAKEPVEAVPYDRFKQVYSERKEARAWKAEHEPKFGELSERVKKYEAGLTNLGNRVGKHPHIKAALEQILKNEDGSFDMQALHQAIQAELEKVKGAAGGEGGKKGVDEDFRAEIRAQLEADRAERAQLQIQQELDRAFTDLPSVLKADKSKAFEGIEVDADFLQDVEDQLNADASKSDPNDIAGSVLKAAQKVAARYQKLTGKVLGKQVEHGKNGPGAGAIRSTGPGGKSKIARPDATKDPVGHEKWLKALAAEVEAEMK